PDYREVTITYLHKGKKLLYVIPQAKPYIGRISIANERADVPGIAGDTDHIRWTADKLHIKNWEQGHSVKALITSSHGKELDTTEADYSLILTALKEGKPNKVLTRAT